MQALSACYHSKLWFTDNIIIFEILFGAYPTIESD